MADERQTLEEDLAEVVDRYHRSLEAGRDPDPEACQAEHPLLAADLAECLAGLGALLELRSALQPAEAPPPFAARTFGDYELLREIGRGGMGVVYEARQISLPRKVALKVLIAGPKSSPSERQRFRIEAEAAAHLEHSGIVRIFEVNELDGEPYFTMEYVSGPSLSERLSEGPLPIRAAAELLSQVADAIDHAHQRGVWHRDLKPSNILLDDQQRPRVTDFGLAKLLQADSQLTLSGAVMGTPSYMAPEQAAGNTSRIGPHSDVYSLGAILYELLTGRPPFAAPNITETLNQVQFQDPVPPEKLNYRIPFELSTICLKCLHKEPERRYASARDLAEDLRAFLDGRPIKARPDSLLYLFYRAVRQEPYPEIMQRRRPAEVHKAWVSLLVCGLVTGLILWNVPAAWIYALMILGGLVLVFWQAPGRNDTLVERQVSSVWQAFLLGCLVTVALDVLMKPPRPLYFSPVIAVLAGMANFLVADLISGWFYFGALACFAAAIVMVYAVPYDFLILGVVFFITLIVPALKYRER